MDFPTLFEAFHKPRVPTGFEKIGHKYEIYDVCYL